MKQSFSGTDNRAAVVTVGFILVVAVLALGLYLFQTNVVPAANKRAEIKTQDNLRSQMFFVDSAIERSANTETTTMATLDTEPSYPFAATAPTVNSAKLTVDGPKDMVIDGAENPNSTVWNGVPVRNSTAFISLEPEYTYLQSANTLRYEHGIVFYEEPGSSNTILADGQTIIHNNHIRITTIEGNFQKGGRGQFVLTMVPSLSENVDITVTNDGSEHITLELPTRLTEQQWKQLLRSERTSNGGHVTDVRYSSGSPNKVIIELERGVSYHLNIYKVEVKSSIR